MKNEKTENLDVDKALAYCDVQVHRALAELEFAKRKMQGNLFSKKFLTLLAVAL